MSEDAHELSKYGSSDEDEQEKMAAMRVLHQAVKTLAQLEVPVVVCALMGNYVALNSVDCKKLTPLQRAAMWQGTAVYLDDPSDDLNSNEKEL